MNMSDGARDRRQASCSASKRTSEDWAVADKQKQTGKQTDSRQAGGSSQDQVTWVAGSMAGNRAALASKSWGRICTTCSPAMGGRAASSAV